MFLKLISDHEELLKCKTLSEKVFILHSLYRNVLEHVCFTLSCHVGTRFSHDVLSHGKLGKILVYKILVGDT